MPDMQWHIDEGAERETIANSPSTRRSRRGWMALVIVVILGVVLGAWYRLLPEPAPRPTSTPSPTPQPSPTRPALPAKLYAAIDQEAQALADGDFEAYLDLRTPFAPGALEIQRQNFTAWGRPQDDRPLYTLVDFHLLTATTAWVDIRQFREGRYFRETRFYYQKDDRWLHGSTNYSLWTGQEENLQMPHFAVTYAIEDRDILSPTLHQLEEDYQALCRDLGCAANGQVPTLTLKMGGKEGPYSYAVDTAKEIQLPSPRVTGFFERGRAYGWKNSDAYSALLQTIVARIHGSFDFARPGGSILWAISIWALNRIDPLPTETLNRLGDLQQKPLLSLETLWEIGGADENGVVLAQLYYLIRFIEQEYGAAAVTDLLAAIDSATSLSEAIENGWGVPFAEFDQKWQAWAKANIPSQ